MGSPTPKWCGALWPSAQIRKVVKTVPPPRRTFKRYWCHPPPIPIGGKTFYISYALSGYSWQWLASHCQQRTVSGQIIWMYPPSLWSGNRPLAPSLWLPRRNWRKDGGAFSLPPSCTFFCEGVLPPISPRVQTYHTACDGSGGKCPWSEYILYPSCVHASNEYAGWGEW